MQRSLAPIIAGCIAIAALVFAAPRPASATTAAVPAVQYGETNAGIVQQVGYRYYRGGNRNYGYRNYGYRNYGYRNYGYRNYGYRLRLRLSALRLRRLRLSALRLLWRLWLSLLAPPRYQPLVRFLTTPDINQSERSSFFALPFHCPENCDRPRWPTSMPAKRRLRHGSVFLLLCCTPFLFHSRAASRLTP